jgi:ParB-like chromosome segregation protein Spo0J
MQTEAIETTLTVKRSDLLKVPSSLLRVKEGFNIRTDYGDIPELAESAKVNGIIVPLRGYKDKENGIEVFIVTDGHRRTAALKLLLEQGVEVLVPFILESKGYSDEQRILDMFIMNDGKSLMPLEQAEGVRRLIAYGYSEKEIAGKLAKSEGYIRKLNSLNNAPKQLRNLIEQGVISATLAIEAIAKNQVEEILKRVEEDNKPQVKVIPEDPTAQDTQSNDGAEINDVQPSKVTRKDLQDQNSMKEFKKFLNKVDEEDVPESVLYVFQFAAKLAKNKLSYADIQDFFQVK